MPSRRLLLALLLLGCPPAPQTQPPPPVSDVNGDEPRGPQEPPRPVPPASEPAPTPTPPAFSAPKADGALADILPAPTPASGVPGACEGGTRRAGETWKVECNECSCGDDGQTSCTAMACLPRPVR
jgi:hypothetical protein